MGFGIGKARELLVLVNADQGRNHPKYGDEQASVESVSVVLPTECHADDKRTAEKHGHEHFHRGSRYAESIPAQKSGET